jgi:hypothetical protein
MRLRPGGVHPGNTLSNESTHARCQRRRDQVSSSLAAHSCVPQRSFSHATGIKAGRKIGELMNYQICVSI